jgi:hypothetical protein
MSGLADFHADAGGKFGGQSKLRPENAENQRIAAPNHLNAAAHAHAEHLEPLHFLVVGLDAPHDGANARRQFVQTGQRFRGMVYCCHSLCKISLPAAMSISARLRIDANETGFSSSPGRGCLKMRP